MTDSRSHSHRIRTLTAVGLSLLPVLGGLYLVVHYGLNVCSFDEFRVAFEVRRFYEEGLALDHLYGQHVVHRHFLPLVVMLFMAILTGFNSVACMYLSWSLYVVILGLLYLAFRRHPALAPHPLVFVPVALLVFSAAQFENFTQAFQLTYSLPLAAAIGALYGVDTVTRRSGRSRYVWLGTGIILAAVSALSATMGLFVWIAALIPLGLLPERRSRLILSGVWMAAGAAVWIVFLRHFQMDGAQPLVYYLANLSGYVQFVVVMIGNALFYGIAAAPWIGAIVLLSAVLLFLRLVMTRRLYDHAFWIALAAFSLLSLMGIAVGRLADGMPQAMASKYTSYAMPLIIAVYAVVARNAMGIGASARRVVIGLLTTAVVIAALHCWVLGTKDAEAAYAANRERQFMLYTYDTQPDPVVQSKLRINPSLLKDIGGFLKSRRLNVFSETNVVPALPVSTPSTPTIESARISTVNLVELPETADSRLTLTMDQEFVYISGWAIDERHRQPAGGVYIEIDGRPFAAFYGLERPDIAQAYGGTASTRCGFERFIRLSDVGVGIHDARLFVIGRGGEGIAVAKQRVVLEVRAANGG